MTYRIAAIPMTLSDIQGHSRNAMFSHVFSYSYAAVDNISSDIMRRAVSLR